MYRFFVLLEIDPMKFRPYGEQTLVKYFVQTFRKWLRDLGTSKAFDIGAPLSKNLLKELNEKVWDEVKLNKLNEVSALFRHRSEGTKLIVTRSL
jgi:hypothetical protein